MRRIPSDLKVGGIVYYIRLVPLDKLEGARFANIDPYTNTIKLAEDLPLDQQWAALWHEIYHAMNSKLTEQQVEFLAQLTWAVLHDNGII